MNFGGGMSQAQIGQQLRISQMHVSRLRARALGHLRSRLLDPEPHVSPGQPGRSAPAAVTRAGAGGSVVVKAGEPRRWVKTLPCC
jgi:hypothetical protein